MQHPDGLYYGPRAPSDDATLIALEDEGRLGHRSVRRGEYRYVLRHPEQEAPRPDRFGWADGDVGYYPVTPEDEASR